MFLPDPRWALQVLFLLGTAGSVLGQSACSAAVTTVTVYTCTSTGGTTMGDQPATTTGATDETHTATAEGVSTTGTGATGISTGASTGTATGTTTGTSTGTAGGASTGTAGGASTGTATGASTGTATGASTGASTGTDTAGTSIDTSIGTSPGTGTSIGTSTLTGTSTGATTPLTDSYSASATTTVSGTLPSAEACYTSNMPVCGDVDAVNARVDDSWLGTALCAYAYADPSFMLSRAPCDADGKTGITVTLYDPAHDDVVAVYVAYEDAQAEGLVGDANGFAWWPAAWRMAAASMNYVTGTVDEAETAAGNATVGLELVGGPRASVQAVGGTGLSNSALVLAAAPNTPTVIETSGTATTLQPSDFYVVMNYTDSTDQVFLDGLNGQWQYYALADIDADIVSVSQGAKPLP